MTILRGSTKDKVQLAIALLRLLIPVLRKRRGRKVPRTPPKKGGGRRRRFGLADARMAW